jgi:hypothetical protein
VSFIKVDNDGKMLGKPAFAGTAYLSRFGLKAIRLTDEWAQRQFFLCMSASDHRAMRPALGAFLEHLLAS